MSTPKLIETLSQYRHDGERWHHVFTSSPKRKGLCRVIHCRREARLEVRRVQSKLRTVIHPICCTCRSRLHRANHPAQEAYRQIKERAARRKQVFDITFEQFCAIPRFQEYLERRGRGIDELHMDREKVELGYVPGNLRVITAAENLRKQREVDYCNQPF